MQTREILSLRPDGSGVVFTQELRPCGDWYNRSARLASPTDMQNTDSPTTPTTGLTGSSNAHARLSPSDSKRWTTCTAAIAFQEANAHRVKKDNGSIYSDEGTEAHEYAAKLLAKQMTFKEVPEKFKIPLKDYVAHCIKSVPTDSKFDVEVEIPLWYQQDQKGTCDFAFTSDELVVVRDLKFGAGVLVYSVENTQLAIYTYSLIRALSEVYDFSPDTVVDLGVFQPRHREATSQKPWVMTLAELSKFCADIEYRAIQAREGAERVRAKIGAPGRDVTPQEILEAAPGLVFAPGEGDSGACRWCKCKAFCSKRLEGIVADIEPSGMSALEMLEAMPTLNRADNKLPVQERIEIRAKQAAIPEVTDQLLVSLFTRSSAISSFLDDVKEYLELRAKDGENIEGVKLVKGREGNRAWLDEAEADRWITQHGLKKADRYDQTLKSPTKIEALLSNTFNNSERIKRNFEKLITRSAAREVLASIDDKRPAVLPVVNHMPSEYFPETVSLMPRLTDDSFEV